jgi:uncharacterized protein
MKKTFFSFMACLLAGSALLAGSIALTSPALAQSVSAAKATVDAAKAQGVVGEQSDGFLGIVNEAKATDAIEAAVDEINSGRSRVYAEAAAKNGVSPVAAGSSAFSNIIMPKLKAGEYFKDATGVWKMK